jgi:hypothetical protein
MRTGKIALSFAVICISTSMALSSCKKKKEEPEEEPQVEENGQSSTDSRNAQDENDQAVNDINESIGNYTKLMGKGSGVTTTPCGLTIDTTGMSSGSLTLNYTGVTCKNRTRTGTIKLAILNYAGGARWKNAGTVIKVDYVNYKITRASDGKSITLNGTQNLTNITGGTWWELLIVKTQTSVATSVTGTNLKATFEDGKTATYNINRKFTYTIPGDIITCKGEGIGTSGSLTNLENFGTTRDGDAFTSQVSTPIIWNWTCGPWAPIQGAVNVKVASKSFDLKCTFGVDANGNPVTVGANQCPYGWKLEWTVNNKSNNKVFGYL